MREFYLRITPLNALLLKALNVVNFKLTLDYAAFAPAQHVAAPDNKQLVARNKLLVARNMLV